MTLGALLTLTPNSLRLNGPTFAVMTEKSIKKSQQAASYEEALAELERLLAQLESGQLPLDSLLKAYERGAELLSFCRGKLEVVEQQFKVLEAGGTKAWGEA
jgi:exodeoxyribonuclease VII small subunit